MNKLILAVRVFLIKKLAGSMSVAMNMKIDGVVKFNSKQIFSEGVRYAGEIYDYRWKKLVVKKGQLEYFYEK